MDLGAKRTPNRVVFAPTNARRNSAILLISYWRSGRDLNLCYRRESGETQRTHPRGQCRSRNGEVAPWRGIRALLEGRGARLGCAVHLAIGLDGSIFGGKPQAISEAVEACKAARLHQHVQRALFAKLRAKILVISIRH